MTELHAVPTEPTPITDVRAKRWNDWQRWKQTTEDDKRAERHAAITDTEAFIKRFVLLDDAQSRTCAVWVAHTWAIEAADCTPYLHVSSTQPRAGKSRLLEVLEQIVNSPLRTSDMTEAALFHSLSEGHRTLLLDEVDTVFRGNAKTREGLRALLNASYRRGSPVRRVRGRVVESYEAFNPKVIAGIGKVPDTIADRSIPIRLERKSRYVEVERFRLRDVGDEAGELRDRLELCFGPLTINWDLMTRLRDVRPVLPDFLNDRAQDSWECLFAIGDEVGMDMREAAERLQAELEV